MFRYIVTIYFVKNRVALSDSTVGVGAVTFLLVQLLIKKLGKLG